MTSDVHAEILAALIAWEPLFHRTELGTSREHFESMTVDDFWEVVYHQGTAISASS